jgi:FkbH-like protein
MIEPDKINPESHFSLNANWDTYSESLKKLKMLDGRDLKNSTPLKIVLGGNANVDFLVPGLTTQLLNEGFNPSVSKIVMNSWIQETFNEDQDADVWVIWLSGMGATQGGIGRFDVDVEELAAATNRLLKNGCSVLIILPEPIAMEDDPFSIFTKWRRGLVSDLENRLSKDVILISIEHLVVRIGMEKWYAPRYWEQAKLPCHPDAATLVGVEIGATLTRLIRPIVKAVVVDLDDTLWGGLVGEVGPEGLNIDASGTGRSFLAMQRFLLDLTRCGIALAVVSKNDIEQAKRPFNELSEMILRLNDFVMFDATWEPKFNAIERLAKQLNIGVDSICFLDDSEQERSEAKAMIPSLIVPSLPVNPSARVEYLTKSRLFMTPKYSEEDRLRIQFFQRDEIPVGTNLESYLSNLNMEIDALPVIGNSFDRSLSLLHKTNQFNLSLWRPSRIELHNFASRENNYAFAFQLKDRLGDVGITSVLLADSHLDHLTVRAWVVSCRVFSRGFEWATIAHLSKWLETRSIRTISFDYVEGPRNKMVTDVLTKMGLNPHKLGNLVEQHKVENLIIPNHQIRVKS